jgi:hypothetical protein
MLSLNRSFWRHQFSELQNSKTKLGQNERVQREKRLYAKGLIEYLTM